MDGVTLACEGIRLSLGGRQILDDVHLSVGAGEILGVAGPNGAGKTSLFEVLTGRYRPQSGSVRLGGRDITGLAPHRRARLGLGRTYQSPVVPEALSVGETLVAARKAFRPRLTEHDAEWAARRVHLDVDRAMASGSLETLDRRKLLLAAMVMRRPSVLLLDEPASGLLGSEIEELDTIMRELALELGIALIVVEHRLELLVAVADRVAVLDVGRVIADGRPDDVFRRPEVRAAYFDDEIEVVG